MQDKSQKRELLLWIIRWQDFLSKCFRSKILASISMFYIPIMAVGLILEEKYDYKILSYGVVVSLIWIAIAPFLIQNALDYVYDYFNTHKGLFRRQEDWEAFLGAEARRFQSSKYLFFGLPWATVTSGVVVFSEFNSAPLLIQVWAGVSFFIVFLVSSIGFYAVYILLKMMGRILPESISFNPYHPDKFGGISEFGRFSVKISLYYSTGALAFPLAFEIINKMSSGTNFLHVTVYLLVGFFLFVMFVSFLVPIFQIKNFVDPIKEKLILDARFELDKMVNEFKTSQDSNIKQGLDILMHYYFNYSKLLELKDYPWDFRVLIEYSFSFVIPLAVAILQIFFK